MELVQHVPLTLFDGDLLLRLGGAAVLGLLLGLDRELRGHAAGMRTHGLICLAAAIVTISIFDLYFRIEGERMDPLRVFEATGAFVGIVAAGLIVFSGGKVHNLTTAANLWMAAAVGIACGAGQWPLVAFASLIAVVLITVLRLIEPKDQDRDDKS